MRRTLRKRLVALEAAGPFFEPDPDAPVMSRFSFELFISRVHLIYGEPDTPPPIIDAVPTRCEFERQVNESIARVYADCPPDWNYDAAEAARRANESAPEPEPLPLGPAPKPRYRGPHDDH